MNNVHSDALVFFGATGDLAYKKIFPSLQAMIKRGHLNAPVIGVARANWSLDQFAARVRDSLEKHGGVDTAAFDKLRGLLRYVSGDDKEPAYYLAIPPALFGLVVIVAGGFFQRRFILVVLSIELRSLIDGFFSYDILWLEFRCYIRPSKRGMGAGETFSRLRRK